MFIKYERLVKEKAKFDRGPSSNADSNAASARPSSSVAQTSSQSSAAAKPHLESKPTPAEGPKLPGVSSRTLNELSLIDFNAMSPADKAAVVASQEGSQRQQPQPQRQGSTTSDPFDTSNILTSISGISLTSGAGSGASAQQKVAPAQAKKASGLPEEISSVREQDFAEIENWLASDSGRNSNLVSGDTPSLEPISVPNSEFENFIASRALAGSASTATQPAKQQQTKPEPSA